MRQFKKLYDYYKSKFNPFHVQYTKQELIFLTSGILTCFFVLVYMGVI
jgi:hypothetical protein